MLGTALQLPRQHKGLLTAGGGQGTLLWQIYRKQKIENEQSEDASEELMPKSGAVFAVWIFLGFKKIQGRSKD